MIKSTLFMLAFSSLVSAASAQAVAVPTVPAADRLSEASVADLSSQARVRDWNLASNSSNAGEIYAVLVKAGGKPVCQDKSVLVNSEDQTVQDCQVTARVAVLDVLTNAAVVWPKRSVVDVQGPVSCQQTWYAVQLGRSRQKLERWTYCQFRGAARP